MDFAGGSGVVDDPWLIATAAQLDLIRANTTASYRLVADIELSGYWTPISSFSGVIHGDRHKISGLQVSVASGEAGLFKGLGAAIITELEIVTGPLGVSGVAANYKGILAGTGGNGAYLYRVITRGLVVTGGGRAGGFIGYVSGTSQCVECATFVQFQGASDGRVGADLGYNGGAWNTSQCVVSTTYSGYGAMLLTGYGSVNLTSPGNRSSYPRSWDFAVVWEMIGGFPQFRLVAASSEYGYSLPPSEGGSTIDCSVHIDGLAAQRRVLAVTEDEVIVSGPAGNKVVQVVISRGVSSPDGSVELDLYGYAGPVWVIAIDDWGRAYQAGATYQPGDVVRPTGDFGGYTYVCVSGGAVGSEPAWWTDGTRSVGDAVFEARKYRRPLAHGPVTPAIAGAP